MLFSLFNNDRHVSLAAGSVGIISVMLFLKDFNSIENIRKNHKSKSAPQ